MKTIINDSKNKKEKPYPKLMINDATKLVVLMLKRGEGICMHPGEAPYYIGYISDGWAMDSLEDLEGSITLSND